MHESLKILEQALKDIPAAGELVSKKMVPFLKSPRNFKPPVGEAYGRVEAPKGELGFYVVSDGTAQPGLRDRAIISVLIYTAVRVGAVAKLRRRDFFTDGRQWLFRFQEKNGKERVIPALHDLEGVVKEYLAMMKLQESNDSEAVVRHINLIKTKYKNLMPPFGYDLSGIRHITTILRLHNTIGDHDAGIAFIDEILAYFRTGKAGDPKPGRVDAEYMKVREAFEQDKVEGFKGCAGSPPGQVCMGRATKALIQSDYFPW
jgi:integrase